MARNSRRRNLVLVLLSLSLAATGLVVAQPADVTVRHGTVLDHDAIVSGLELGANGGAVAAAEHMAILQSAPPAGGAEGAGGAEPEGGKPEGGGRPGKPFLTADQVNIIKQAELRDGDNAMVFRFENGVEKRYAELSGRTIAALRQMKPIERFRVIKSDNRVSRALLDDIRLTRDPGPLLEYKTAIQKTVLVGCASSACHSASALVTTSKFWLHSPSFDEAATYTNFFILATRPVSVTVPSGAKINRTLINRGTPELSLLLQFGLAPDASQFPHPIVPGFKPLFKTTEDPRYKLMLDWISNSLTPLDPDYSSIILPGVTAIATPPTTAPATKPTTKPATRPAVAPAPAPNAPKTSPRPN